MKANAKHFRRITADEWQEIAGEYERACMDRNRINRRARKPMHLNVEVL